MTEQTIWVHPASFTYRLDPPETLLETIWAERPGWGYIRRRDMWLQRRQSIRDIEERGYVARVPESEESVKRCPHCGLYMCNIPGYLMTKHLKDCGGNDEEWYKIEEFIITDQRMRIFEKKVLQAKLHEQQELEEMEKKERFDKIKDEASARQLHKDRKRRLKQETKQEWKRR